jgi:integrase
MTATPQKLKSGRYKVRFRHGRNKAGTGPREMSETFNTLKKAKEFAGWLDALGPQGALDKLYAGEQAANVPSLNEVAADHIEHLEAGKGHRLAQQRLWDRTWGPRIGAERADLISRDQLVKALTDLAENGQAPGKGYSTKSLYNQRGLLFGVLDRCVDKGHLTKHPGRKLKLPESTVAVPSGEFDEDYDDPEDMICLTIAEFELIHDEMTPHYRPFTRWLVGMGTRYGETVVLRPREVDATAALTRITRALKWSPDGKHTIGPPKTKRGRRTLAMPSEVVADVAPLLVGRKPTDLLFTAPRGGMIQHRTFWSDHWRPAIWRAQHCPKHREEGCKCGTAHPKRCKVHDGPVPPCGCAGTLSQSPRIHDLRHTHASWLLARGIPIHVVSARLGHKSVQTTWDIYSHLLPDAQLLAAQAASLVFNERPLELT